MRVLVVGDDDMKRWNREFLKRVGTTNVIAFPDDAPGEARPDRIAGDILVSGPTCLAQTRGWRGTRDERVFYFVLHGMLHLAGGNGAEGVASGDGGGEIGYLASAAISGAIGPAGAWVVLALGFAGLLLAAAMGLGPKHNTAEKLSPFECGMEPAGPAWNPPRLRFAAIALLFVLAGSSVMCGFERFLALKLLKVDASAPARRGTSTGLWSRVKALLSDRTTWTGTIYLLFKIPVGIFTFTLAVTLLAVSIAFVFAPAYMWLTDPVTWNGWALEPYPWAFVLTVIGIPVFFLSLHLFLLHRGFEPGRVRHEPHLDETHRLIGTVVDLRVPHAASHGRVLHPPFFEDAALAAHSFGDQNAAHAWRPNHSRRMELHKFHVHQRRTGMVGERMAVARILPTVAGDLERPADASRGDYDSLRLPQ